MEETTVERPSAFRQFKSLFAKNEEYEEFEGEYADTAVVQSPMRPVMRYTIGVRKSMNSYHDGMAAANALKAGDTQVLCLAGMPADEREKAIHFLKGAIYMHEATWTEVTEDVIIIAPKNVLVDDVAATPRLNALRN